MGKQFLIIADDFTGSNDTGVQLKKSGISTEVTLFPAGEPTNNSIVLDTESRTLSPENAYKKVKHLATEMLENNEFDLVYKKVDSTIRGNISKEIRAVADVYKPTKIVFVPAFPKINRTTKNAVHLLNDLPLMETEVASDPLNPLWTDNLITLLSSEFEESIQHYTIQQIKEGLQLTENYLHVFDITEDKQLAVLSKLLYNMNEKILYVGSAGLAESLFKVGSSSFPTLSVIGSISEVSLEQMNYAEEHGVTTIQIDINDLINEKFKDKYTKKVITALEEKQDTIITVTRNKEDYLKTIEKYNSLGIKDKEEISRLVKEALGDITMYVMEKTIISGLFMTGGDTAIELINKMDASGCIIERELTTGVVESKITDGPYEGLNIVTKAGAFGNKTTLLKSIQHLKGEE